MMTLAAVTPNRHDLSVLLAGLDADSVPALSVAGVAIDSRAAAADTLFLAYQGTRAHGLDYAEQAIARGVTAVAWDRDIAPELDVPAIRVPGLAAQASRIAARAYDNPAERLFVTGITGTDGKTSCAWLLAQALDALGQSCGYLGTLGYGPVHDLAPASHTTPDPVAVQDWLARLAAAHVGSVAFEVSSHALDQHRVDGVAFDVAVLTQIGRDHLDYHGNAERYAAAKRRLFALDGLEYAVLNIDDAHGRAWLAGLDAHVTPVAYGLGDAAALARDYVRVAALRTRVDGLTVEIESNHGAARIDSRLVGRFNAANLAAVLAVLLVRGVALEDAALALGGVATVPGRMERVTARTEQPLVVVDYAHTPGALEQALTAVRAHAAARVFCVFGCGGDRDRGKRALMGAVAARLADVVWLTDDNPRSESPAAIVADIRAGMGDDVAVYIIHDRAAAIARAIATAVPGDVVLIAGKGHETTQEVAGEKRSFDDRVAAHRALEAA